MQFMILFSRRPEKAQTPAPCRPQGGGVPDSPWSLHGWSGSTGLASRRRWRCLHDCGGALRPTRSRQSSARCLLPAKATCNLPSIVPLKPYSGFAPALDREARHESRRAERIRWPRESISG